MTAPGFKYRLQPLLDGKRQLKEDAERAVLTRQKELRDERKRQSDLETRVQELDVQKMQMRNALLHAAASLSGREAGIRKDYLRGLDQDLEAAKDAVFSQKLVVEEAESRLASARSELTERTREVDVLEKHRDRLERRYQREIERKESLEQDEIGNMLYLSRRRTA